MHTFTIPLRPVGKERPRMAKSGHVYTPQQTKDVERIVGMAARAAGVKMIDGPVYLNVEARFAPPKSWSKAKRSAQIGAPHTSKPDGDNILKLTADALNEIACEDDRQFCQMTVSKRWAETDSLTITVGGAS